ncbi:MAG: DUF4118 domain-containing protein [Magnetococcus sp. DMHC-1]|nr:DUF4118 domain-containing protein [Magnetococcales bacterium]
MSASVIVILQSLRNEFLATILVGVVTVLLIPLMHHLLLANILMIYLLLVFLVAVKIGRRGSILASFLSILTFAYFFVPPHFSFVIIDTQYWLILAFMLPIALITAHLTTGLRTQVTIAENRERRILSLYELSSVLTGIVTPNQIVAPCHRFIETNFDAGAIIIFPNENNILSSEEYHPATLNMDMAQSVFKQYGTPWKDVISRWCDHSLYIPLQGSVENHGILVLTLNKPQRELPDEQASLLKTCVTLIGLALERLSYAVKARHAALEIESERLRNALLASLSHDMRTPIAAMAGLADAMQLSSPPLSPTHMSLLDTMRKQVRFILSDIDKLLDMARLQVDHVILHREWQLLEEVIGSAIKTSAHVLEGYEVQIEMDDKLPLLEMDAMLMERVFCNLLENATRHTPVGSRIEIGVYARDGQVIVQVKDNGPGFPPGMEESMFEKFMHGKSRTGTSGVGLGLAIVRAVLKAHGGIIHAENRPEGGACIEFSLPVGNPPLVAADVEKFI